MAIVSQAVPLGCVNVWYILKFSGGVSEELQVVNINQSQMTEQV
ncbi:MAG: hypothetical protein ACYTXI_32745 [Nostoc sp.]